MCLKYKEEKAQIDQELLPDLEITKARLIEQSQFFINSINLQKRDFKEYKKCKTNIKIKTQGQKIKNRII
jgi:hypothetical protein